MKISIFFYWSVYILYGNRFHTKLLVKCWGENDPPDYAEHLNNLMNISEKQMNSFITTAWKLPEVTSNPSVQHWLFDNEPNHPNFVISWCSGTYSCKYMVFSTGSKDWQNPENWDVSFSI